MLRRLYYRLRYMEVFTMLFKLIWIAACVYAYRSMSKDATYVVLFTIFALLLYRNEGKSADIKYFRSAYRRPRGLFIVVPFVIILGYIYNLFGLSFIIPDLNQIDKVHTELINNGIFVVGCVFLMVVFFCRLREFRIFGDRNLPVILCIVIAGAFLGYLLGSLAYVPLGIVITYLYEKFNFPIIMSICTTLCLIAPFWDYSLLLVALSVIIIVLLRKRLEYYGNPAILFLGFSKINGPVI